MVRLSSRQVVMLGCLMTLNATLASIPSQMVEAAKQDAIFAYPLALAAVIFSWWVISRVMNRFPSRDLYAALVERYPYLGRMIGAGYISFFFVISMRDYHQLGSFINYSLLPRTPIIILLLILAVCSAWVARPGVVIIARMTEIYQTFLVIVILMLPLLLVREFQLRNVQPIWEYGGIPVLKASWYAVAYIGELIGLAFLSKNESFPFRQGMYGLLWGVGLLQLLIFLCVGVLNPELTSRFIYPNHHLIREIRITDFLDRFDVFIVGIWIPAMMVKTCVNLYLVTNGITRLLPGASGSSLTLSIAVLASVGAITFFPDYMQLLEFNKTWPLIALFFEMILPLSFLIWLKPAKGSHAVKEEAASPRTPSPNV
jgi:spore germination protein